jgi:hypothetical protein
VHLGEIMKIHVALALVTSCVALAPAVVRADSQDDQQACMSDALSICSEFIPDRDRVGSCLVANRSGISPACQQAIKRFAPQTVARKPAARSKRIKAAAR